MMRKQNRKSSVFRDGSFSFVLKWFLLSRLTLLLIGLLTTNEFRLHEMEKQEDHVFHPSPFVSMWGNFDTGAYLELAANGYPSVDAGIDKLGLFNFFPLYPALMQATSWLTGLHLMYSGILISNLCLLLGAICLFRLCLLLYNIHTARICTILMFVFPGSFFFSGVFSEALFFFLIVFSFYQAIQNQWLQAAIAGALLSACRPTGVFIFIPLLIEYIIQRKSIKADVLYLLLVPCGALAFMYLNYLKTGDPLYFIHNTAWNRKFNNPFSLIYNGLSGDYFTYHFLAAFQVVLLLSWMMTAVFLRLSFNVVMLLLLLIPCCFTIDSVPRMAIVAFPLYAGLATAAQRYRMTLPLIYILAIVQAYMAVCWFLGFGNVV